MSQKISLPASKSTTSKYTKWFVTSICWEVCRKCTKWIPTLWRRKVASPQPDFNNFQGRTVTRSEGTINALVRRAKFSPPVVELVCFIRFSNGYYHSDTWSSTFTDCYPSQHVVYNATPRVHWATALWSSGKWSPLYLHIYYMFFQTV